MNLLVNFFEGGNEGIMGKKTEGRGSTIKWGKTPLEGCDVRVCVCVCVRRRGEGEGVYVKIL